MEKCSRNLGRGIGFAVGLSTVFFACSLEPKDHHRILLEISAPSVETAVAPEFPFAVMAAVTPSPQPSIQLFDCLAVNVVGPGIGNTGGSGDDPNLMLPPLLARQSYCSYRGVIAGPITPATGTSKTIALTVPSGPSRLIQLVAVREMNGSNACQTEFTTGGSSGAQYFEAGRTVTDLFNDVSVDLSSDWATLGSQAERAGRIMNCGDLQNAGGGFTVPPTISGVSITGGSPTNAAGGLPLSYTGASDYAEYCILFNSTNPAGCAWVAGGLPATVTVPAPGTVPDGLVNVSVVLRNPLGTSSVVSSAYVTIDRVAPTLGSVTVGLPASTNVTAWPLTYGANSESAGTYKYCILENDTNPANCSFVGANLPTTYAVSGINGPRTLYVWLKDAAGNIQATLVQSSPVVFDNVSPTVTLTSLTGGQSIPNGSVTNITWNASDGGGLGSTPIKLEYSSNAGSTWSIIVAAIANSGTYAWTTPATASTTMRVRVTATDAAGNLALSASAANFTLN